MKRLEMVYRLAIIAGIYLPSLCAVGQNYNPMTKLNGEVIAYSESMYMYNEGVPSEMTHAYDAYTLNESENTLDHAYIGFDGWTVERSSLNEFGLYQQTDIYETYTNEYSDDDLEHQETYIYSYDSSFTNCTKSKLHNGDTTLYEVYRHDSILGKILEEKIIDGIEHGTTRTYYYKDSIVRAKGINRNGDEYYIIEYINKNGDVVKKEIISDGTIHIQEYAYTYDKHNNWTRRECMISSMPVNSKSLVANDQRKAHYVVRKYTYALE